MNTSEILKQASKNKYRKYNTGNEFTAGYRLKNNSDVIHINHIPKFKLNKEDTVFTIGSCFARNVERYLELNDINLTLKDFHLPIKYYDSSHKHLRNDLNNPKRRPFVVRTVLNKYSTLSMFHDLDRVLNDRVFDDYGLLKVSTERWFNCNANHIETMCKDDAIKAQIILDNETRKIINSDVIIITLGLTEVWKYIPTGLAMNQQPDPALLKRYPSKFSFEKRDIFQTYKDIENIIKLVTNKKKGIKFILTVSPVPMGATFTNEDVIIANEYSKSTLLSCAKHIASKYDFVDYYPSYEMIKYSDRQKTWSEDQVHPKYEIIDTVIRRFINLYVEAVK